MYNENVTEQMIDDKYIKPLQKQIKELQAEMFKLMTGKTLIMHDVMPQSEQLKAFIRWNNQHNGIASPVPEGMADHYIKSL